MSTGKDSTRKSIRNMKAEEFQQLIIDRLDQQTQKLNDLTSQLNQVKQSITTQVQDLTQSLHNTQGQVDTVQQELAVQKDTIPAS